MADTPNEPTDLIRALGRVTSGIYILTAAHGEASTGMLASWVQQAGFDPPMVTFAVKKDRYVAGWLAAGAPLALNVVGEGGGALLKHFGRGFEPGEPAFEGVATHASPAGAPLLDDAVATLEGVVEGSIETPDHVVFLARVEAGALRDEAKPMVHLRKRGDHY